MSGVMSFAMWISLVVMVFFVFNTCCLIKYAATRFFGGGGKQGRGGATWIGMFSLCCSGIQHITGFDGSKFLCAGGISFSVVIECDVDGGDGCFDFQSWDGSGFKGSGYES